MKDFFDTWKFKILIAIAVFLVGIMAYAGANGRLTAAPQELLSVAVAPFQRAAAAVSSGVASLWENYANIDAILNAWYGGQEAGTAVADILFGDYNPSGRLPVTFYKSIDQLPDFEDYSMKGRTYRYMTETPLYPFGYGLSYTNFAYRNAKLSSGKITKDQSVTLTFDIANTGKMDGDEVAQIYIKNPNDPEGPIKALKAFLRVHVKAGDSQEVNIELTPEVFHSFNDNTQTMEVRPGKYQILYGGSSDEKALERLELTIE